MCADFLVCSAQEKMKSLCVPFRVKALSELRDPQFSGAPLPFSVMLIDEAFLSKIKKDRDESKFKFLRGLHLKWVVVSDPKKLSSATDIKVLYGIDGDSVSAKASMAELFECIQVRNTGFSCWSFNDYNLLFV